MIDTHCHIDDEQYIADFPDFIAAQQADGVEAMIVPGVNIDSLKTVPAVCHQFPGYLFPAIGLHPEEVNDDWQSSLRAIVKSLQEKTENWIAIGEIGLDYHFDTTYKIEQQEVFRTQLRWALDYDLPVIIHARDATEDTIRIIEEVNAEARDANRQSTVSQKQLRGVFHCFSGSHETALKLVQMGFYLGIGGVITFKNCKLADNLQGIPVERILLETDSPYMAPVPHRGQRNESRWMSLVLNRLSIVYSLPPAELDVITTRNARTLFSI